MILPPPRSGSLLQWIIALAIASTGGFASLLAGASAEPAPEAFHPGLAREAMLLLKAECFSCHNERKRKGGLVLTSRDALLKGGDSGPVAEAGRNDSSRLTQVILADADPHMPPESQLSEPQINLMREWVRAGMPWDEAALLEDDGKPVELLDLPEGYHPVLALALAPDAKRLAVGRGGAISVHEASAPDFLSLHQIAAHRDAVQSLAWSPDGRWLASGAFRRVMLWSGETFDLKRDWAEHLLGKITALQFSPDSTQLVLADGVAGRSGVVRVIGVPGGELLASWPAHDDTIFALDLSRDSTRLVTAGGDRLIKVWDMSSHREVARFEGHAAQVLSVAFNADATEIVSGGADSDLNIWDVQSREKIISLGNQAKPVSSVNWTGDGKGIIAVTSSGVFAYTNLQRHTGAQRSKGGDEKKIGDATDSLLCAVATPDGATIFAGGHDGSVQIWNRDSQPIATLTPHDGVARSDTKATNTSSSGSAIADGDVVLAREGAEADRTMPRPVSFVLDVLPGLTRAGCSAGACHAKAEGQNGFKLSVFSYDPKGDYDAIVKSARGRRVFPAAPDQSLLVQKPTTGVDHEGGRRFERGSELHQLLVRWLREGMAYRVPGEPELERLTVTPPAGDYRKLDQQQLVVQAHYSDGSQRDVTRLAAFASNDPDLAAVDENGLVKIGDLTGQGVVVARYMGFVADLQITVPADRLLPESRYASLPRNNFIDDLAYAHFQKLGLYPSELCTDAEFIRRAKLDAIGVLPTPDEVREFLADPSPDKRGAFIRRVLDDPAYADYWAMKWADLLRPNPDRVGLKSVFILDHWLRERFRRNTPYDQFAREILLAEGSNHRDGPAVIYRDRREPADRATMFSQVFLGTRLECARCHNHPNEKWTQNDFYQFAAIFGSLKQKGAGVSPPISPGMETFYVSPGSVKHPVTGDIMSPRPLDASFRPPPDGSDPRRMLVESLLAPDNPYFAAAAVNRVWANFFGRGLVEPVDDFRITNPAVNPALLAALARDFVAHGYDLKHFMRTIMESRLYQLSSTPNEFNLTDARNFSRAYRRRLPAEVLLDAVNDATGTTDTFAGMPPGSRAVQAWSYKIESQFMDAFSRPDPSMDPPCERDTHISVVQSLHLMNSKAIQTKFESATGRARQLADSDKSPEEVVTELYLTTLSRPPGPDELGVASAAFTAQHATRRTATEDVFWALLNSAEFVFNH